MPLAKLAAVTRGALDFSDLVCEHQSMVYSLAYHFLRDRTAAEEIAQEVFLELHLHLGELQSVEHVVFWLRRVTANRCIDEGRRRRRHPELQLDETVEPVAPATGLTDPLRSQQLRRLVASLPGKACMMVLLRYQEDLDPRDIADLLNVPLNTVKSQLQRALAILRQMAGNLDWKD
jgi:RNA polymerase sigma-70 factor (ECF subfamily)